MSYGLERCGKAGLAAMLRAVRARFDSVSYVVVDDVPTVDPDLVIVEVRGDNHVRGSGQRYQNHSIMFLSVRTGLVHHWRVLESGRLPNGGTDMSGVSTSRPARRTPERRTNAPERSDESGRA